MVVTSLKILCINSRNPFDKIIKFYEKKNTHHTNTHHTSLEE